MARPRNFRLCGVAMSALSLLAVIGARPHSLPSPVEQGAPAAAMAVVSVAADAAILPARVGDSLRAASSNASPRMLVVAAVLAALGAMPAHRRRALPAQALAHAPLHARRHAISLRAPPDQSA